MKKLFNLRLPALYAASLATGILYSAALAYFKAGSIYIVVPVIAMSLACIVYGLIKKNFLRSVEFAIAILVFIAGAVYLYCLYIAYSEEEFLCGELVKVSGTVDESGATSAGNTYIVLGNVSVNGKRIYGRVIAYLSETAGDYCRKGYSAEFYSQLTRENFISGGGINYHAISNVKYRCNIFGSLKAEYRFSLFGEMNYALQQTLFDSLDGETAAVAYAMLTGNTEHISQGTLSSFRYGGIAHIFAVSGLHIGVIYGALTFVFKKTGVNRFVSAAIRIAFIILFAGMCNFSPSSVRAITMCSVTALASCTYNKYDGINSLAVAAIILLLINPLYLFGAGFVLSFSAMLGLFLFSNNVKRALRFLPDKVGGSIAVGVSAQLGTMPANMAMFGYISAAGLILNLILIPLISAFYVLLFFLSMFSAIVPAVGGALLPVACAPLELLINFTVSCGFENTLIGGAYGAFIYVPFLALVLLVTDRINLSPGARAFASILVSALLFVLIPSDYKINSSTVTFGTGYDGGYIFIAGEEGKVLVITEDYNGLGNKGLEQAETLVVLGGDYSLTGAFANNGVYRDVYLRGGLFPIENLGDINVHYADSFYVCGMDFNFKGDDLLITVNGVTISATLNYKGDTFGVLPEEGVLHLYCFENQRTVLFEEDGESYGLDVCGEMKYTLWQGRYALNTIIPRE